MLDVYSQSNEFKREQQLLSGMARRSFKKKNTFICDICSIFLTSEKYCTQVRTLEKTSTGDNRLSSICSSICRAQSTQRKYPATKRISCHGVELCNRYVLSPVDRLASLVESNEMHGNLSSRSSRVVP